MMHRGTAGWCFNDRSLLALRVTGHIKLVADEGHSNYGFIPTWCGFRVRSEEVPCKRRIGTSKGSASATAE